MRTNTKPKDRAPERADQTERYLGKKLAIVWSVVGVSAVIIGCLIAVTVVICSRLGAIDANTVVQMEFLEVGLAIIGLAVVVWAGLNIANALDRGDVANAVRQAGELKSIQGEVETAAVDARDISGRLELSRREVESLAEQLMQSKEGVQGFLEELEQAKADVRARLDEAQLDLRGELDQSREDAGRRFEESRAALQELLERFEQSQAGVQSLSERCESARQGVESLGEQLEQSRQGLETLTEKVADARQNEEDLSAQFEYARLNMQTLTERVEASEQSLQGLRELAERVDSSREDTQSLSEQLENARLELKTLREQVEASEQSARLQELAEELETSRLSVQGLREQVEASQLDAQNLLELTEQVEASRQSVRSLTEQVAQSQQSVQSLSDRLDAGLEMKGLEELTEQVASSHRNVQTLNERFEAAQQDTRNLAEQLAQSQQSVQNLSDRLDAGLEMKGLEELTEQVASSHRNVQTLSERFEAAQQDTRNLAEQLAQSQQNVESLTEQVARSQLSVQNLSDRLAGMSGAETKGLEELTEQVASSHRNVQTLSERFEAAQQDTRSLTEQVEASRQSMQSFAEQLAQSQQSVQSLTEQVARSQQSVQSLAERIEGSAQDMRSLSEKFSGAAVDAGGLAEQLEQSRAQTGRDAFLHQLLSQDDPVARYFLGLFSASRGAYTGEIYSSLTSIEQLHRQIRDRVTGVDRPDPVLIRKVMSAEYLADEIERLQLYQGDGDIGRYILVRKALASFYRGFAHADTEQENVAACKDFDNAASGVRVFMENILPLFATYFSAGAVSAAFARGTFDQAGCHARCGEVLGALGDDVEAVQLVLDMVSVIGAAYGGKLRRMARAMDAQFAAARREELGASSSEDYKNAVFFCACAVELSERTGVSDERYYRELGGVYEQYGKLMLMLHVDPSGTWPPTRIEPELCRQVLSNYCCALDYYRRALQLASENRTLDEDCVRSVYAAVLSCYDRVIRLSLGLWPTPSRAARFDFHVIEAVQIAKERQSIYNIMAYNDIVEYVRTFATLAYIAISDMPRQQLHYCMSAFANIWVQLFMGSGHDKAGIQRIVKNTVDTLELLGAGDDYYYALKNHAMPLFQD